MHYGFMAIEDFYDEPLEVRRMALALDYPERDKATNYPGSNSTNRLLPQDLDETVSRLVNEPVKANMSQAHGICRTSLAEDNENRLYHVHVDLQVYWSGILCLSLPEHCQGGTEFFRHKKNGLERAPVMPGDAAVMGYQGSGWDVAKEIIERDSNDTSKWEMTMQVPLRFNRLLLIRPWYWHTAGLSFGSTLENGRLVQLFFFDKA